MKRLAMGGKKVWLEEAEDPRAEPGWAVVRTKAIPLCGSEKHAYYSEGENRWGGHEGTGVVEEIAEGSRLKVGDRVLISPQGGCEVCELCRGGNYIHCPDSYPGQSHSAELVKKREAILCILPDDVSFELGSMAGCALSPGFSSLERMGCGASDTVLVTGLGPVGLGAVTVGSYRGARVLAVEPVEFRRDLATDLGAEATFDPTTGDALEWVREQTGGRGVSLAVDCSGRAEAERLCIDAAAVLGKVCFCGENGGQIEVSPSSDFIRKGLTLLGTWHMNLLDVPKVFRMLQRRPEIEKLITHRFPFAQVQEAYDVFFSGQAGKVLLLP